MNKPLDDLEAVRKVVDALDGFEPKDKERILRWAREKLGLTTQPRDAPLTSPLVTELPGAAPPGGGSQGTDIRTFVAKKNPTSDTQFAATVAYYYRFEAPPHLRKDSITSADLQDACRQVDRERIVHAAQTLVNAHAQGLLDRGERGTYVINTVGENLVAMALPSGGAAQPAPRRKKKSKKKGRKS